MTQGSQIMAFHKGCAKEYNKLLEHFNLLFYGYGCKVQLLQSIFPHSVVVNCRFHNLKEVVLEAIEQSDMPRSIRGLRRSQKEGIELLLRNLDEWHETHGTYAVWVLLNFDFKELAPLRNAARLRIVGTIEDTTYRFSYRDFEHFNFIFRDLTTFLPYKDEIIDMAFSTASDRVESASNVYGNVPKKAQFLFLELLKLKKASVQLHLTDLFDAMRKKLLLKSKNECLVLLAEFIDHGLIKTKGAGEMCVALTDAEITAFCKKHS